MSAAAIILAAGYGVRMQSATPKVLHQLAGKPLILHTLDSTAAVDINTLHVVCRHGSDQVRACVAAQNYQQTLLFHEQTECRGTADAVVCATSAFDADKVLVLYADVPCVPSATLARMLEQLNHADLVVLSMYLDNSSGYGRIVRDENGNMERIVEEKDANVQEKLICEVNSGILAVKGKHIRALLGQVDNNNVQKEYYLPDIVAVAQRSNLRLATETLEDPQDGMGINTFTQLHAMERHVQKKQADALLAKGCCIRDAQRLDIRGQVQLGCDVVIDVNVVLEGKVELGDNVSIGPNCYLKDVVIGEHTTIQAYTWIDGATIGRQCSIGPYARLRPDTRIDDDGSIGNFVEVKKSSIGEHTKVNHLSYIGDTTIGKNTNIGAGTITCNYDGAKKYPTTIGDNVFIGSNTQLIAPVNIAQGATIGAGSTITDDAPQGQLTLARTPQKTVANWRRPKKDNT